MNVLLYELVCFTSLFYVSSVLTRRSCYLSTRLPMNWVYIEGFSAQTCSPAALTLFWSVQLPWACLSSTHGPNFHLEERRRSSAESPVAFLSVQNGIRFPQPTSPQTPSVNSLPLRQTPEDSVGAMAANSVHKCYLLRHPSFLNFFFFNVGCHGSFPVHFGVGLVNKAAPQGRSSGGCLDVWGLQTGL